MRAVLVAAVVALATITVFTPTAAAHCDLPTSVECIEDWHAGVGDCRWARFIQSWTGIYWCPPAAS